MCAQVSTSSLTTHKKVEQETFQCANLPPIGSIVHSNLIGITVTRVEQAHVHANTNRPLVGVDGAHVFTLTSELLDGAVDTISDEYCALISTRTNAPRIIEFAVAAAALAPVSAQ